MAFTHLARLTDDTGLFEHARHATARREHGYCTDDVARGLVVTTGETAPSAGVLRLAEGYPAFLTHVQRLGGHPSTRDRRGRRRCPRNPTAAAPPAVTLPATAAGAHPTSTSLVAAGLNAADRHGW